MTRKTVDATVDKLLAEARSGGDGAALAARRAAVLAERNDPGRAREALALAARLAPLDTAPRLALVRLHAEAGDLEAARREANAVYADAVDQAARARASFMLGEIARVSADHDTARAHYEVALRIEDALLSADRADPAAARWYARARGRIAELDAAARHAGRARAGAEGALAMLRASAAQIGEPPVLAADIADAEMRLAAFELDDNQALSARRRLGEAIARYEALAITEPDEPHWRAVLADAWALAAEADHARGEAQGARASMDRALQARLKLAAAFAGETWALAGTWRLRGALLSVQGDAERATDSFAQARAIAEQLAADGSEAPVRFLVHTLLDQADHALRSNALAFARDAADEARMRAEAGARLPDGDPSWFVEAAACWDRLGEVARLTPAPQRTVDALERAAEFRRMACARAPSNARFKRGLAAALLRLGDAALAASAPQTARIALIESTSIRLGLAEAAPGDPSAAHALAAALERLGFAALACGDRQGACGAWEDELALAERIFADDDLDGVRFRAIVESHLAEAGGGGADAYRRAALARFETLAKAGALTEPEAALRRRLWQG